MSASPLPLKEGSKINKLDVTSFMGTHNYYWVILDALKKFKVCANICIHIKIPKFYKIIYTYNILMHN